MSHLAVPSWRRFLPPYGEGSQPSTIVPAGQSILVTGAGGHIGSALVRALAQASPRRLVLLDSSEHNLFQIEGYLQAAFGEIPSAAVLGSVEDRHLLDAIFTRYRPETVYHAAAYKHVPLLELNPFAAIHNNAVGSYVLLQAALHHGASKVVSISTDKAVNPHSIMGVSKRIAELAVVAMSGPACRMNAIRLVNVIGSPGSVAPLFWNRIANGRPAPVTHPEVSRWFLSLTETVDAILASGNVACEGRILAPEPGEPVRIAELAEFLIRAASREIPIEFTGLRPGDKLVEELFSTDETRDGCDQGLQVFETQKLARAELDAVIQQLAARIAANDLGGLLDCLASIVPEYVPSRLLR